MINDLPNLLVADKDGRIYDHPTLKMAGMNGRLLTLPTASELIPLPEGSRLYLLPGAVAYGFDPESDDFAPVDQLELDDGDMPVHAVSAFLPPAYTRVLLPAADYSLRPDRLPLYAYTAVGWKDDMFWTAAVRIDFRTNWDIPNYMKDIRRRVKKKRAQFPHNRLLEQLERCALEYGCGAAYNAYCDRGEFPIPTAEICNSACVGCISLQDKGGCVASHERVTYRLTPEEIAEVVVPHFEQAAEAVGSFGQGCEGEPLTQWKLLEQSTRLIRARTDKGTINLNTNGSLPKAVLKLCQAGLQSIRLSLNSAIEETYVRYYRPRQYRFADALESLRIAKDQGLFTTMNLLIFPGVTDQPAELDALRKVIAATHVDMIQCRNLNIDPDWYLSLYPEITSPGMGVPEMLDSLQDEFPWLQFGYFNRPKALFQPHVPRVRFSTEHGYPSSLKPYQAAQPDLADV